MAKLPKPINQVTGEPSWRWRRITVFFGIGFSALLLARLIDAEDTAVNETIASGAFWLFGVLVLVYTGFATVQDVTAMITTRSGRPYAMPVPGSVETVETTKTTVTDDSTTPPKGFAES